MKKIVTTLGLVLLFTVPAWAQDEDYPRGEIFGGFSFFNSGDGRPQQLYGFETSFTGNFHKNFGLTGDFGAQFKSIAGVTLQGYQYLVGPRVAARGERVTGFGHVLFGGETLRAGTFSTTGFAMAIGGGLDVNASENIAIRVIQLDWVPSRLQGVWFKRDFRAAVGVVVKLGGGS
ncbi:MAG: hypothetical protein ACE5HL_07280 [Terriglobia bacterium]